MKRSSVFLIGAIVCAVVFSSCGALKKMQTSDNGDVYLDPKKDRSAFYKPDEPKVVASEKTAATVPEMDPNNPYYKDPAYSPDDYYDNQYASRLKRFHNPTYGLGYYDSYYTNSYFYNQNPYQYGVSIYNGYNFWGPSYNNYMYVPNYNWGGWYGYGSNFGYNSYCGSGWGWNSPYYGYNSPYYNNWYNPYGFNNNYYGYNSWNNPYYTYGNGYGYSNPYDYNSSTYYGPRVSHSGSNSRQVINPGMSLVQKTASPHTNSEPKTAVAGPTDIKRFEHIAVPKETYTKNPIVESTPRTLHSNENTIGNPGPKTTTPVKGKDGFVQPVKNDVPITSGGDQPKPKKGLFNNNPVSIDNSNSNSGNSNPAPKKNDWFKSEPIKSNSGSSTTPSYSSPKSNNSGGSSKPSGGLRPR